MKKIISIIVIIFILSLAGIGYFVFTNTNQQAVNPGTVFDNVKNFFPFGKPNTQTETQVGTSTNQTDDNTQQISQPKLVERMFQISSAPTAGYTVFAVISTSTPLSFGTSTFATTSTSTKKTNSAASSTKQTDTFVRFMERVTGHVYEVKIPTLEKKQISNITSPKVYDAVFSSNGSEVISRQLNNETINTTYNKLSTSTTITTNKPYPYNTDIVIAKKDSIFYTIKSQNGSVGYISTFDNKKPTQVFSTPLRDILAEWSGGDIVAIFPKPHSDYPSVLSFVDTKKGISKQVLSGVNGLTVLPNSDATYFLYNTNSKNLSLSAQKVSSGLNINIQNKTLPEKCVWSKKNINLVYCAVPTYVFESGYPEKWYQGVVSFNDKVWSIDVQTGNERLIYDPSVDNKPLPDITNLTLNDKENYLFFINKKDLTLWGLSL